MEGWRDGGMEGWREAWRDAEMERRMRRMKHTDGEIRESARWRDGEIGRRGDGGMECMHAWIYFIDQKWIMEQEMLWKCYV